MNEAGFAEFLSRALSFGSVRSYISIGRRIERMLVVDLSTALTSRQSLETLESRVAAMAENQKVAGNCISVLRSYAVFSGVATQPARAARPRNAVSSVQCHHPEMPTPARPVLPMLRKYSAVMDELRASGIVRTGNGPVGDYAEHLFAAAFGWELAGNSSSGHDAVDSNGRRIQIKARRLTSSNPSRQLSALRRLEIAPFDDLAGVLFAEDFTVLRAILIPHGLVLRLAKHVRHTNSWRFMLEDRLWEMADCRDVTTILQAKQKQIG